MKRLQSRRDSRLVEIRPQGLQRDRKKSILLFDHLTPAIHAGAQIDVVAAYRLARALVFNPVRSRQGMMRTAHVAP